MPPLYACPRCHSVLGWIGHVRWSVGLTDYEPRWLCAGCLEELRRLESEYALGRAFAVEEMVWDVRVIGEKGARRAAAA
jgi:hypothetical protein